MLTVDNLMTCSVEACLSNSDNEPVEGTERTYLYLFNKTQITEEELEELINNGKHLYDPRLIEVTKEQLKFLEDNQKVKF